MLSGLSIGKPSRVIFQEESGNCIVEILAPKYFNILSVWSLDKVGSITVVFPVEDNPANRMLDLIWAEATGLLYSSGNGILEPLILIGKLSLLGLSKTAPVFMSGLIILFIGLLDKDSSPKIVASTSDPAISPIINLDPVPELPMSNLKFEPVKFPIPFPKTSQIFLFFLIFMPKVFSASSVAMTSSLSRRFLIFIFPVTMILW